MTSGNDMKFEGASPEVGEAFCTFCDIIAALRAPDGCPWDREQTHASIASNMIEEACEAVDAIEKNEIEHLREELGDVLLQVVLQSQIASEAGEFDIADVIADIHCKIVRRHPHVFGAQTALRAAGFSEAEIEEATTPGKVLDMWEHIKAHERKMKEQQRIELAQRKGVDPDAAPGLLEDVPRSLPALQQAQKISKKAANAGFEWEDTAGVWEKVFEEIGEFNDAAPETQHATEEFGDILFSLVNVARKEHIDAEEALRCACAKFRTRWAYMERGAQDEFGMTVDSLDRAVREQLWEQAKQDLG